ncbi:MAG: hypothetical protein F6J93_37085 [Oscillatoria sp. SIO1A7]|nr:hypothetical protein [Oscillatoria sp. SIO1A7]
MLKEWAWGIGHVRIGHWDMRAFQFRRLTASLPVPGSPSTRVSRSLSPPVPRSQCPSAQFPIPNFILSRSLRAQCPMPNSQCPIPYTGDIARTSCFSP